MVSIARHQGFGGYALLMMMGTWSSSSVSSDIVCVEHLTTAIGRWESCFTTGPLGGMCLYQGDYYLDLASSFCSSLDLMSTVSSCWIFCLTVFPGFSWSLRQRGSTVTQHSPSWTRPVAWGATAFFQPLGLCCLLFKEFHFPPPSQHNNFPQLMFLSQRIYSINLEHINILKVRFMLLVWKGIDWLCHLCALAMTQVQYKNVSCF